MTMTDPHNRVQKLADELMSKKAKELKLAQWSHWLNVAAMVLTLMATAVAVTYGMLPNHSSQITAVLALLPGGFALLATSLKLENRCNWHYKRYYALSALVRTLEIELPESPTPDQLKVVSTALSKLEMDMELMWEQTVSLDWKHFQKNN